MALWGNTDQADNSPLFAPARKKQDANTANRDAMFGNTSVGTFAADDVEATANKGISHAGWQLRTEGTGGRAGRVHYETLVAMSSVQSDAADDAVLVDNEISIDSAPQASTVTAPAAASFSVTASINPAGTLAYQWQVNTGSGYGDIVDGGVYTGATTDSLAISDSTGLDGNRYRVIVSEAADNAEPKTTIGVLLTVE